MKLHHLVWAALTGIAFPVFAQPDHAPAATRPSGPPNIIVILADDLGYGSLGCYGNREIRTPNLDQLAATGVRLTDFHSNGSVCSPARAALLTGRYPQRCAWVADEQLSPVFRGQRERNPAQRWAWGISTDELTIPRLLKQSGYHTGIIGKWHLGYDVRFHPMNHGFDEFRGFMGGNVDYHTHIAGYGLKQLDWWNHRELKNEDGYATDLLTRHATDFIAQHKEQPFFLYVAHGAPHDPWQGRDPASTHAPAQIYREMIGILDESVGKVVEALRTHRLDTNTLLIFCSDNGAAAPRGVPANAPLRGRKGGKNDGGMSEGGHRVPCLAAWPGVLPAGRICDQTVMAMDFLPTFAKLAGAAPPDGHALDGMDVLPVLKGDAKAPERALHWRFGDEWAVRLGAWKLMGNGGNPVTLVNLADDLAETVNHLKSQPGLVDKLMKLHEQWTAAVGSK
jgi:arylsulfatase A-like enzyme